MDILSFMPPTKNTISFYPIITVAGNYLYPYMQDNYFDLDE